MGPRISDCMHTRRCGPRPQAGTLQRTGIDAPSWRRLQGRFFEDEIRPNLKHKKRGLLGMASE